MSRDLGMVEFGWHMGTAWVDDSSDEKVFVFDLGNPGTPVTTNLLKWVKTCSAFGHGVHEGAQ